MVKLNKSFKMIKLNLYNLYVLIDNNNINQLIININKNIQL